jgi:predicted oxidoreductase
VGLRLREYSFLRPRYFALVSGGAQASGPFRGNAVVELAGSVGGSDERVLAEVPARRERLDYRNGQILAGEVTAAEVAATALRILVVDEEGRTRAVQRLALP